MLQIISKVIYYNMPAELSVPQAWKNKNKQLWKDLS